MSLDFSLIDASGNQLVTLLRDTQGNRYLGKVTDGSTMSSSGSSYGAYANQVWDPISACVNTACSEETLYAGFHKDGTIRLDQLSITYSNPGSVTWLAGLLNYGFPVSSYRNGDSPVKPSSQDPDFMDARAIGLFSSLPRATFGAAAKFLPDSGDYPADLLVRLAVWTGGTLNGNQVQSDFGMTDPATAPCNNGIFQHNGLPDTPPLLTTQYGPQEVDTPCARSYVPSEPRNLQATQGTTPFDVDTLHLQWDLPAYHPGTIRFYQVAWSKSASDFKDQSDIVSGYDVTQTSIPSYPIHGITNGSSVRIAVAAVNESGAGLSTYLNLKSLPGPVPPSPASAWTYCAWSDNCYISHSGIAAYGVSPKFYYKEVTAGNYMRCTPSTFGAEKSFKGSCFIHPQLKESGDYIYCALSGETCNYRGLFYARMGDNSSWGTALANGSISCIASRFSKFKLSDNITPGCYYKPIERGPESTSACAFSTESGQGTTTHCNAANVLVAYGGENGAAIKNDPVQGQYFVNLAPASGLDCSKSSYESFNSNGGDPLPDRNKTCHAFAEDHLPDAYQVCASENAKCSFEGWAWVAFGYSTQWVIQKRFGGVDCTPEGFGFAEDPLPTRQARSCRYSPIAATVVPHTDFCAYQNGVCSAKTDSSYWWSYGAEMGSVASYVWIAGSVPSGNGLPCHEGSFADVDPFFGINKTCTEAAWSGFGSFVSGYEKCAGEGGTCVFPGVGYVSYGLAEQRKGHMFYMKKFTGPVKCSNSVFGDPDKGYDKYCYWTPAQ